MKAVVMNVPPGETVLQKGQRVDLPVAQFAALAEGGFVVTASEYDAAEAVRAEKERGRAAGMNRIKAAVVRAKDRSAIEPKDETVQAKAIGRYEAGEASEDVLIEMLDAMQAKASDQNQLLGRVTKRNSEDGVTYDRLQAGTPSLVEHTKEIVRCTDAQDGLVKSGPTGFAEARKLALEAAQVRRNMLRAYEREDFLVRDMVKAATFTDPNTQVGSLAGDLVVMRNLGYLVKKLAWVKKLTTDLSGEPGTFGQTILTRYITPPDVLTWVPGVGFTSDATAIAAAGVGSAQSGGTTQASGTVTKSVPSTTDVNVVLNQFKATEIEFPVSLLAGTVRNLFGEQYAAQTYSLAEHINRFVLNKIYSAVWTPVGQAAGAGKYVSALNNWKLAEMIGIKNALTINQVPDVGRFLLMHSFYHDKLLEDPNLLAAKALMAIIHKNDAEFNTGELPTLFGVQPLESQLSAAAEDGTLTAWTDSTQLGDIKKVGFAGNMSSMLFVSRPPTDFTQMQSQLGIPPTASIRLVTEPDSGLTVMVFNYANNGKMSLNQRVCLMYGAAQGDPRVGIVLRPQV